MNPKYLYVAGALILLIAMILYYKRMFPFCPDGHVRVWSKLKCAYKPVD